MATLEDLLNAQESAATADATATATLLAAQNAKVAADGTYTTATTTFAHALQGVGSPAVDTSTTPYTVYSSTDGVTVVTSTAVSLTTDISVPPAPPAPNVTPPSS